MANQHPRRRAAGAVLVRGPGRWEYSQVEAGVRGMPVGEAVAPVRTCELRHFVEPCLLLLLRERPSHGYELVDRLRTLGLAEGDPAAIYRTLRSLERDGLAWSTWRASAAGPARRTYHLTADGLSALDAVTREVRDTRRTLDAYLDRYSRYAEPVAVRR